MKLKIEVKSRNNYLSPPHTHTSGGGGAYYLAPKDNYSRKRNCSVGPLNTKIPYCLHKQTCLDYIKLHGVHGNLLGAVAGSFASRPKIDTCMPHILSWIFSHFR